MTVEELVQNPKEVGRRIGAARGYCLMQRPAFAKKMEIGVSTLRAIEQGELASVGRKPEKRRSLLEQAQRVSKCPPEIVGLSESAEDLRAEVDRLLQRIEKLEIQGQDVDDASALPPDETTGQRSEGQGPEAVSG